MILFQELLYYHWALPLLMCGVHGLLIQTIYITRPTLDIRYAKNLLVGNTLTRQELLNIWFRKEQNSRECKKERRNKKSHLPI